MFKQSQDDRGRCYVQINSLIIAFKGNKETDKTLRSSHTPYVLMFYQCTIPSNSIFILLVKVNQEMRTSFL